MRFLLDAQLPKRLAAILADLGQDAMHTSQLPRGNRTSDSDVIQVADVEHRIVVTKDREFVDSHVLSGRPHWLLLVSTGNIRNAELVDLFVANVDRVVAAFEVSDFIELSRDTIVVH